jgi:hypothetical protein
MTRGIYIFCEQKPDGWLTVDRRTAAAAGGQTAAKRRPAGGIKSVNIINIVKILKIIKLAVSFSWIIVQTVKPWREDGRNLASRPAENFVRRIENNDAGRRTELGEI